MSDADLTDVFHELSLVQSRQDLARRPGRDRSGEDRGRRLRRLIDVAWNGPHTPVDQLDGVVHLPPGRLTGSAASAAVEQARAHRDAALRGCRCCDERTTPGHMHDDDVCQSCAERHLGVVH